MANGLEKILESDFLNEETKSALQEAWNNKITELKTTLREEVKAEVGQQFKERYENDKNNLVEAMNNMLEDAVKDFSSEQVKAAKALKEEKEKLTASIAESRKQYKAQLTEHVQALDAFVLGSLKEAIAAKKQETSALEEQRVRFAQQSVRRKEAQKAKFKESIDKLQTLVLTKLAEKMSELNAEKKSLQEEKHASAQKLIQHRAKLNDETSKKIDELNKFVMKQLRTELTEFQEDRRSLVEMKVKLATEAKAKLAETQKAFITRASKLVTETVDKQLKKEISQLKEDIKIARENRFGRKIFEAVQAEFLASRLSNEGSKIKEMAEALNKANEQLSESKKLMQKQQILVEKAEKQAKFAKDDALRTKTLNELLRPLNKDKREIMESLLGTVKTESLKESYNKYLKSVLNESFSTGKKQITEKSPVVKTREVTGNKPTRLNESAQAENGQQMAEIIEIRRLAGIE